MSGLLVAAFGPFGGRTHNRALRAVRRLAGTSIGSVSVEVVELPVVFEALPAVIAALVDRSPRALLLVGESHSDRTICVERIALNLIDARIADNAGAQPRDREVVTGGPLALATPLDVRALVEEVTRASVPCAASAHAGTFCCNAAYYLALQHRHAPPTLFVHVPARRPFASDLRAARALEVLGAALLRR